MLEGACLPPGCDPPTKRQWAAYRPLWRGCDQEHYALMRLDLELGHERTSCWQQVCGTFCSVDQFIATRILSLVLLFYMVSKYTLD